MRRIGDRRACILTLAITASSSALLPTLCPSANSVALRGPSGTFASWARDVQGQMASFKP